MKKFNSNKNKKAKAFTVKGAAALITAALLVLALLFTACPNNAGGETPAPPAPPTPTPTPKPKHAITFSVDSTTPNGTLKAKADGVPETEASPITVEEGKTVTFTAKADDGYRVKGWTLDGNAVNGTNNSYSFTVTKPATVKVSFENTPPEIVYEFVDIQGATITGVAPGCTLPGNQAWWKGVFIDGRKVKLSPYKLGKTEVTYELWYQVRMWAESQGYTFANKGLEGCDGTGGVGAAPTDEGKKEPVTNINWRDCIVWCNAYTEMKLGSDEQCVYRKSDSDSTVLKNALKPALCDKAYADMSKKGFRLPTEAEWEYAARRQNNNENAVNYGEGGSEVYLTKLNSASGAKKPIGFSGLTLPEGETWKSLRDELTRVAVYKKWFDGSNWVDQPTAVTKTAAVKSKDANALGLYDMSGNVWEWCFDRHKDDPASNDSAYMQGGIVTDPQGAASDANRVQRGGSWNIFAGDCTVGYRVNNFPDNMYIHLGFRLACLP